MDDAVAEIATDALVDIDACTCAKCVGRVVRLILAERERCAKLADEQVDREEYGHAKHAAVTIAQNIRGLA